MSNSSLQRKFGLWACISVVVGSIIGSGIFMKPATMAAQTGSALWLTAIWIIGGAFSLIGALIYAEMGALFPQTGGQYVFLQKAYGGFPAFLYGWAAFSVINTASVAAMSFVFAQYADYFLHLPRLAADAEKALQWHIPFLGNLYPLENLGVKSLAVGLVLLLTFLNYLSVRAGSALQVVSTTVKLLLIGILVFGIFLSDGGSTRHFIQASAQPKTGWALLGGCIAALTGAFMAYDGWANITFMAGETKDPQKNIPRSLVWGVIICIVTYLFVTQAYLYVLPIDEMAGSPLVASDAIGVAMGRTSGSIVAFLIVICTLGAVNGNIMAVARITYAMGRDRIFIPWTGKEHQRFGTPGNALLLHGIWTSTLIFSGSFDMLADLFTFVTWGFYGLGGIALFTLRRKFADSPRTYKVWGYPWLPLLFIAFSLFYVISTIANDIENYKAGRTPVINSLLGILITAIGIPIYWYRRSRESKASIQSL